MECPALLIGASGVESFLHTMTSTGTCLLHMAGMELMAMTMTITATLMMMNIETRSA